MLTGDGRFLPFHQDILRLLKTGEAIPKC